MDYSTRSSTAATPTGYAPPGSADDKNRRCERIVDLPVAAARQVQRSTGRKPAATTKKPAVDMRPPKRVQAFVRTRPTEKFAHHLIRLNIAQGKQQVIISRPRDRDTAHFLRDETVECVFQYDGLLHNLSQENVYDTACSGVVRSVLAGINGSVICYGQAGSGKTYTACGPLDSFDKRGFIPRALSQMFGEKYDIPENEFNFQVSYIEIYNEALHDLLSGLPTDRDGEIGQPPLKKLAVAEDNRGIVAIKGLTLRKVVSVDDALNCLFEGEVFRAKAKHDSNPISSRSHTIFTIYVQRRSLVDTDRKDWTFSRLDIVDLAGAERLSKTMPNGKVEQEAMHINRSLTFLEQTITALAAGTSRKHVPFRQSKLPHVLKHCLGGNCHTVMVANVRTDEVHIEDTLATLRFVERAVSIPVEAKPNFHASVDVILQKQAVEIELLREELAAQSILTGSPAVPFEPLDDTQVDRIREKVTDYLDDGDIKVLKLESMRQIREVFQQFRLLYMEQAEEHAEKLEMAERCGLAPVAATTGAVEKTPKDAASTAVAAGGKASTATGKLAATSSDSKGAKSKKSFKAVASGLKGKTEATAAAKEEPAEVVVGDLDPSRDGIAIRTKKSQPPAEVDHAFTTKLHTDHRTALKKSTANINGKPTAQKQPPQEFTNLVPLTIAGGEVSKVSSMLNMGSTTALSSTALPVDSQSSLAHTSSSVDSIKKSHHTVLGFVVPDTEPPPPKEEAFDWYKTSHRTGMELHGEFVEAKKALREAALVVRNSALELARFREALDEIAQWLLEGNVKSAIAVATGVPQIQRLPNLAKRMKLANTKAFMEEANALYKESLLKLGRSNVELNSMKQRVQESRRKLLAAFEQLYSNSFGQSAGGGSESKSAPGSDDAQSLGSQTGPSRTSLAATTILEGDEEAETGGDVVEDLTAGTHGTAVVAMTTGAGAPDLSRLNTMPGHMATERASLHTELDGLSLDPRDQARTAFNNARIRAKKRENEIIGKKGRRPGAIVKSPSQPTSTLRAL